MFLTHSPNLIPSLIGLLIVAGLTAYYASYKGRNPFFWFICACLIGIFAPLILFFLTLFADKTVVKEEQNLAKDNSIPPSVPSFPINSVDEALLNPLENKLWHYLDQDHKQMGPVSVIALRELWNTARLNPMSYVWSSGMEEWKKIDELPDLKNLLNKHIPL